MKKVSLPIRIYINVAVMGNVNEVLSILLSRIEESGLYKACEKIFLIVNGDPHMLTVELERDKYVISNPNAAVNEFEFPALDLLWEHSQTEDFCILYLHTKGVSRQGMRSVEDWIEYLIHFNIDKWRRQIAALVDGHDTSGVSLEGRHENLGCHPRAWTQGNSPIYYSGNFWWSKSSYVRKLPKASEGLSPTQNKSVLKAEHWRLIPEMWLCHLQGRHHNLWSSNVDHYQQRYPKEMYRDDVSRTYDAFLFFNELELLELRLRTLDDVVDVFVLVESPWTFSGKPKPLYFQENKSRFKKWLPKIRHIVIDKFLETDNAWKRDFQARDEMILGLYDAKPDDLIFQSDCDEIWRPELRLARLDETPVTIFDHAGFYYFLNARRVPHAHEMNTRRVRMRDWRGGQNLRDCFEGTVIENGGWHFSYVGGVERIIKKLESFAHTEYSDGKWTDAERISRVIERGDELFERPYRFVTVTVDDSFPKPLRHNRKKWKHLLHPDTQESRFIREDLIFAVPTLNRYEALLSLLRSVEIGTIRPAAYLIIDNGGKLKDEIKKNGWKLPAMSEIIEPGENIGVAASWNLALGKGIKYTVLAGDDCIFEADALEKLLASADKNDGPGLFWPRLDDGCSEWGCFLQNKSLTDLVGMYDERFWPGYFEDDDYRHRMSLFGIAPVRVPAAFVNHIGGATSHQFDQSTLWINEQRYEEKWGGPKGSEKVLPSPPIVERIRKIFKSRPNIVVYTITKNEEKFIARYCEAAQDADEIVIIDTGSTDATVEIAEKCGATVHRISISPWRFDTARSASLALLRSDVDVCVAADADEVLEPGWREEIERVWMDGTTRLRYLYDWGSGVRFMIDKIHARHGYIWKHPCHERLVRDGRSPEKIASTEKLMISHLPDPGKPRGHYLELLKLGVEEDPNCAINAFYYGREFTFWSKHSEAILELKRFLNMPTAIWDAERACAMRLLGHAYEALDKLDEAVRWFIKATEQAPGRRESWFALAETYYRRSALDKCFAAAVTCLSIPVSPDWLTDVRANGALPYDYAAISAWRIGKRSEAIEYGRKAADLEPENPRLAKNLKWYLQMTSDAKEKQLDSFFEKVTDALRAK